MTGSGGAGEADTWTGRSHCRGGDGQRQLAGWGLGLDTAQGRRDRGRGGTVRGDSLGSGAGRLPVLGSSCTPGVEWVVLRQYNRGTGSATVAP